MMIIQFLSSILLSSFLNITDLYDSHILHKYLSICICETIACNIHTDKYLKNNWTILEKKKTPTCISLYVYKYAFMSLHENKLTTNKYEEKFLHLRRHTHTHRDIYVEGLKD